MHVKSIDGVILFLTSTNLLKEKKRNRLGKPSKSLVSRQHNGALSLVFSPNGDDFKRRAFLQLYPTVYSTTAQEGGRPKRFLFIYSIQLGIYRDDDAPYQPTLFVVASSRDDLFALPFFSLKGVRVR